MHIFLLADLGREVFINELAADCAFIYRHTCICYQFFHIVLNYLGIHAYKMLELAAGRADMCRHSKTDVYSYTHTYVCIYMHAYMVCVCVCMCICVYLSAGVEEE